MTFPADVEDASWRRRQRQQLDDEPRALALEAGGVRYNFRDPSDGDEDCNSVEDADELDVAKSSVFDADVRCRYESVSGRRRPTDFSVDSLRKRPKKQDGRSAAELFPVSVVTSSVARRPRASLSGSVGGMLPTWLPWLLPMTSLVGLVTSLPVDSDDASRSPVKVFDGNTNDADVDGPVVAQFHISNFLRQCTHRWTM